MASTFVDFLMKTWVGIKNALKIKGKRGDNEVADELIKKHNLRTWHDVVKFLSRHMQYEWDPLHGAIDTQKTLSKIVEDGFKGDCDDYAMACHTLLTKLGYQSAVVTFQTDVPTIAHAVCMFKTKDGIYSWSTEGLHGPFKDIEQALEAQKDLWKRHFNVKRIVAYDVRVGEELFKASDNASDIKKPNPLPRSKPKKKKLKLPGR